MLVASPENWMKIPPARGPQECSIFAGPPSVDGGVYYIMVRPISSHRNPFPRTMAWWCYVYGWHVCALHFVFRISLCFLSAWIKVSCTKRGDNCERFPSEFRKRQNALTINYEKRPTIFSGMFFFSFFFLFGFSDFLIFWYSDFHFIRFSLLFSRVCRWWCRPMHSKATPKFY